MNQEIKPDPTLKGIKIDKSLQLTADHLLPLGQSEHLGGCQLPCQAHHGHRERHPEKCGPRHHLALIRP